MKHDQLVALLAAIKDPDVRTLTRDLTVESWDEEARQRRELEALTRTLLSLVERIVEATEAGDTTALHILRARTELTIGKSRANAEYVLDLLRAVEDVLSEPKPRYLDRD